MKKILYIIILVQLSSCANYNMFKGNKRSNDEDLFELLNDSYAPTIAPDDKLSFSVWNHDDMSVGSAYSIYNTNEAFGKWLIVSKDSLVKVPHLGAINIVGLTLSEAEQFIEKQLSKTIKNPIVEIKILNAEVSILGEVKKPGKYLIEKDLNTLVEFIAEAQGLTSFAQKKKIQVIRDNISYRIDLTRIRDIDANNIYLKSGDILYVPAVRSKKLHERAPTLIPFATMLTSIGVLVSVLGE
ncbi:polysaccharide biosynthesis/export family protein [Crocinitomix algicola]|uniref:polysaccharide biosynthesis/export family protein n=1 Tax=Crocinitomix algicola TaxID=1740263 RepID=UPI0008317DC0|nr:polysaccharide biosynthesis/export family protein [Crocinitomix algicola]